MNSAELTALHGETLAEARLEKTLANIARRAETLLRDGYTATEVFSGFYRVDGPKGQLYMVTCDVTMGHDCTCPAFVKFGTCKHLQAVDLMQAEEWQAAMHDAAESDRDAFRFDVRDYERRNFCEAVN